MKTLQIVSRHRGMTNVQHGFSLDNDGHKQAAAQAATRVLQNPADLREIEYFPDLHGEPLRISNLDDLQVALRSSK